MTFSSVALHTRIIESDESDGRYDIREKTIEYVEGVFHIM